MTKNNMLLALVMAVIVLLGAVGFLLIANAGYREEVGELQEEMSELKEKRAVTQMAQVAQARFERKPRTKVAKANCPVCEGAGKHIVQEGRNKTSEYACPVCTGHGYHQFRMDGTGQVCTSCRGMGKIAKTIERDGKQTFAANLCVRCNGKGWRPAK